MKNTQFALFMVLNGRATEALTFYQEAFVCRNEYHAHRTIDPQLNRQ